MEQYAGIDVSLESACICVVDANGRIVREAKVASEPDALIAWFRGLGVPMSRIGLEAGPLSQWLYAGMREAGLAVELLETRHVRDAFKAMPVKTDRNDARGIAQLMRLGWFRSVHCKSLPAQELRALLTARKLVQEKRHDPTLTPLFEKLFCINELQAHSRVLALRRRPGGGTIRPRPRRDRRRGCSAAAPRRPPGRPCRQRRLRACAE